MGEFKRKWIESMCLTAEEEDAYDDVVRVWWRARPVADQAGMMLCALPGSTELEVARRQYEKARKLRNVAEEEAMMSMRSVTSRFQVTAESAEAALSHMRSVIPKDGPYTGIENPVATEPRLTMELAPGVFAIEVDYVVREQESEDDDGKRTTEAEADAEG